MDYETSDGGTLERVEDLGTNPRSVVKRWLLELQLAGKREEDWRKKAEKTWEKYRQKNPKKNSFNILWSNTETLRPAVYNSVPKADVRRRFKDDDPLGKAVAEVLNRAISYSCDTYDFDGAIKGDVLDMLLPGRAVSRIRYIPSFSQVGVDEATHAEENEQHEPGGEALEGEGEELNWEQVVVERVQWDDFRIGPGKSWEEVQWVAFRHRLSREELIEKFGEEIGNAVPLDATDDQDIEAEKDDKVKDLFKTALVWEIWHKEDKQVLFIAPGFKEKPCMELDDPLNLLDFFPIPRPLYALEDSGSTVPVPLYTLYSEQADELDRISTRINTIVKGLKLRGVYDATISELSELMRGEDNDLVPAQNVTALLERGGLEKAIWMWPIEQAANVLKVLYEQRDAAKQVIYEITGIADIVRGASVASETATAQSIKDKWSNIRLKRMQQDVQRYIRDLIRIKGEIIAEKFQLETLKVMTGLKFPMLAEKQQAMMMYQQAQQMGQQVQPPPNVPCWEEIIQVLRDDAQRSYKVDIETDSTIAATVDQDMQAVQQVTQALGIVMKEFFPLVQEGLLPVDAAKELLASIARRARFGSAFDDAIEKIQQPPPKQPEQDNSPQTEQIKQQGENQRFQAEQQFTQQLEAAKLEHAAQIEQMRQSAVAQQAEMQSRLEQYKADQQAQLEASRIAFERWKAQLDAETKVAVAELSAQTTLQSAQLSAAKAEATDGEIKDVKPDASHELLATIVERMNSPRKVVRGADGKISGVE